MFNADLPTSDKIKHLCKDFKTQLKYAYDEEIKPNLKDLVKSDIASLKSVGTSLQKYAADAEQDLQKHLQQQQQLQYLQIIAAMRLPLKEMLSYALSRMPSHLNFWGVVNPHLIHLRFVGSLWQFNLVHSVDAHDMPMHFHNTASELQCVVTDIFQYACNTLRSRVISDASMYQYNALYNDTYSFQTDFDYLNSYTVLYQTYKHYLFVISGVTMIPTDNGVRVTFLARFDDAGLSPYYYFQNVQSVYCI